MKLTFEKVNAGSYIVTLYDDNQSLSARVNDSHIIDCAFDDDYDLWATEDNFYESQEAVENLLINYIKNENNQIS